MNNILETKMLNAQIVELYENSDMEPIAIAEALNLEEESVKTILISSSSKFRKAYKENKNLFTDDEFILAKQRIAQLIWSDRDNVAFRAAKFIVNENLGRNSVKNIQNLNINVSLINDQMRMAKKAIQEGKDKVIEVPSEISHLAE